VARACAFAHRRHRLVAPSAAQTFKGAQFAEPWPHRARGQCQLSFIGGLGRSRTADTRIFSAISSSPPMPAKQGQAFRISRLAETTQAAKHRWPRLARVGTGQTRDMHGHHPMPSLTRSRSEALPPGPEGVRGDPAMCPWG
jgi:hypothetical protein